MAADGDGRSLSAGISIPQWMKSRIAENKLGFDESSFSPPENDDSFFYFRYPQAVTKKLKSPTPSRKNSAANITGASPATASQLEPELANHTAPCKQYILQPGYQPLLRKTAEVKVKSNGTDDGFKGEGAACGTSIVRVAHQMVSGKLANNAAAVDADPLRPQNFNAAKRRGSRSLPVTPLSSPQGSPTSRRKLNKYFTGPFVDNEHHGGSWILQSLLGKRELSQSMGLIAEEHKELERGLSDLNVGEHAAEKTKAFKPKPSEFRELNFWSPTSM